jgi:hypothetical protein
MLRFSKNNRLRNRLGVSVASGCVCGGSGYLDMVGAVSAHGRGYNHVSCPSKTSSCSRVTVTPNVRGSSAEEPCEGQVSPGAAEVTAGRNRSRLQKRREAAPTLKISPAASDIIRWLPAAPGVQVSRTKYHG